MTNKGMNIVTALIVVAVAFGCKGPQSDAGQAQKGVYLDLSDNLDLLLIGMEVVDSVGNTLRSNLMQAMASEGPVHAVEFCNTRALSLTGIYDDRYAVEVRRASDRWRNPKNAPSNLEAKVITDYRSEQNIGIALKPKLALDNDGRKVFFSPIFTGAPCLICHGNEANMDDSLREKIIGLYTEDNAKGFNIDELRGVWSVTFKNS